MDSTSIVEFSEPGNQIYKDFVREDKHVKPHPVQEEFLQLPDEIFEALYGGAAYGGKSWLLTLLPLFRGFYKYAGFKGIIFRRKFPDLEKEIIRLSKVWYPKTGGTYNEQKHSWEWKDYQSYMDFGHVQHEGDIKSFDTSQYNYCAFDELTHFSAYPYHYMVGSRVRPGGSFNVAIARNGTNPGGIGQNFVYDRFIKPDENGRRPIRDKSTGLYRIFIPAKAEDNPYGMEYDPLYVKKLEILAKVSPAEYRAKRYGDWHAFKGSVFPQFRPIRFPGEPDNALHIIEPFQIPKWWTRILSIDWGKRAMCHAMWGAVSPDSRAYIYRERTWHGRDIPFWASEIKEINEDAREEILLTILCGSAWQSRGTELISDEFQKYSGLVPTNSENTPGSRVAGLQLVHDFLRWEQKRLLRTREEFFDIAKSQFILRNYGEEAYEGYKKQFYDEPEETNLPVLQIFEGAAPILIETIPMAVYNDDKGNPEDIAEFDGDDPLDNLRYFCKGVRKFLDGSIGNKNYMAKLQEIEKHYEATGDMTAYYRQMEHLERSGYTGTSVTSAAQPVAMSHYSRFARRRVH